MASLIEKRLTIHLCCDIRRQLPNDDFFHSNKRRLPNLTAHDAMILDIPDTIKVVFRIHIINQVELRWQSFLSLCILFNTKNRELTRVTHIVVCSKCLPRLQCWLILGLHLGQAEIKFICFLLCRYSDNINFAPIILAT